MTVIETRQNRVDAADARIAEMEQAVAVAKSEVRDAIHGLGNVLRVAGRVKDALVAQTIGDADRVLDCPFGLRFCKGRPTENECPTCKKANDRSWQKEGRLSAA